jgi:hypothetical protein
LGLLAPFAAAGIHPEAALVSGPIPAEKDLYRDDAGAISWPALPEAAQHGVAGELSLIGTIGTEADPAGVLVTALTWASALIGSKPVQYVGDADHYARLFCVLVGASSKARKGTTEGPVRRVMKQAEILDPISGDGMRVRPGGLSSAEGLISAVRDDDEGVGDKRLLCIESEFGRVLRNMQRQGNTLGDLIKQAWDGGDLHTLTKDNPLTASNPHICIVGHITQDELSTLLTHGNIYGGLGNRFLWCCIRRNGKKPHPVRMRDDTIAELAGSFRRAFEHARTLEIVGWADESVRAQWASVYDELSEGGHGVFGAMTGRSEAQVLRLAMVYALLDEKPDIEAVHLDAALALWDYCGKSATYLFGHDDPIADAAAKVMKHFTDIPNAEISRTELGTLLGSRDKKLKDKVVQRLLASNLIDSIEHKTPGRTRTVYRKKDKKVKKPELRQI